MKFSEVVKEFVSNHLSQEPKKVSKMLLKELGAKFSELEVSKIQNEILIGKVADLIPLVKISKKYEDLENKIAKCYINDNGDELSEEETEKIDLNTIGEIAASHFGWL